MNGTREETTPERRDRVIAMTWLVTTLAIFALMVGLGITMRLAQAGQITLQPQTFYALMTMHGLGMAGTLFSAGIAILWLRLTRICRPSRAVMQLGYVLFTLGAVGLVAATLVGGFGPGWYALYPLPFVNAVWPSWSTGLAIGSLMLMGVAWLLVQLDILRAMAARYGVRRLLAWDHLRKEQPKEPLPALVLIASMCTIAGALAAVTGAATLMMYIFKWQAPTTDLDPLLLKNMMFMFGHTIVNVTMYAGIGVIYDVMPGYTKRPWKVNRLTAIAWNATLFFVLFAYFHHLYMDFAQPTGLHYFGQVASYASAVPATAVTVFGLGSQIYRSGIRWSFTPLAFSAGIVGWVIGGVAAVLDSTIAFNRVFHNTLWVPGHFHTYFVVGYVLILLGFMHHALRSRAERWAGIGLTAMVVGGYAFVLMFYLGGLGSVPRRYASYASIAAGDIAERGASLALYGAIAAVVFLLGALVFYASLLRGRGARGETGEGTGQPLAERADQRV